MPLKVDPDVERLLTPAAREVLSELMRDLREQLLRGAAEEAVRETGAMREVTVGDLARAFAALQPSRQLGPRDFKERLVRQLLRVYAAGGLLLAFGGVVGLFYAASPDLQRLVGWGPMRPLEAASLVAFGIALYAVLGYAKRNAVQQLARLLPFPRYMRASRVEGPIARFLMAWASLEVMLRSLASTTFGESAPTAPLSELLRSLRDTGALLDTEMRELSELLQLRNRVAHSPREVPPGDVYEAVASAERLTEALASHETRR